LGHLPRDPHRRGLSLLDPALLLLLPQLLPRLLRQLLLAHLQLMGQVKNLGQLLSIIQIQIVRTPRRRLLLKTKRMYRRWGARVQ
jgi:hypothetical protein